MRKVAFLALPAALVVVAACVDVPRSIRADFAEPRAHERSNFRKGKHGETPEAPADAGADAESEAEDASRPSADDGGAP